MKRSLYTAILLLVAGMFYGLLVEPNWLEVRHLRVQNAGLQKALAGKVGLQLSDLHLAAMGRKAQKVLERIHGCNPAVFGGFCCAAGLP